MSEPKEIKSVLGRDVFLFAAGAVITALSIRYADNFLLWNCLIYFGVAVMAASIFDFIAKWAVRHRNGKMLSLVGMIVCGIGFTVFSIAYFRSSAPSTANVTALSEDAVAHLSMLGWTIKPDPAGTYFQISSVPLPDMEQSAFYFKQYSKPFKIQLQLVSSLNGLHYLSGLTNCVEIQVNAGEFTDLSELSRFVHLKSLAISQVPINGSGVVDLAPLSGLIALTNLNLGSVNTRSITPLSGLHNIKMLYLGNTPVTDISVLSRFTRLESLNIFSTRITDLTPIGNDQALQELMIGGLQTSALSGLSHLKNLKMLTIFEEQPFSLAQVADLPNLETLIVLMGVFPIDLEPIGRLTKLRTLSMSASAIANKSTAPAYHVEIIGSLHNLNDLTLGGLQVSDLRFLSPLQNLTKLSLIDLPISSLAFLQNFVHLQSIYLCDIQIADISPLLALPALSSLQLLRVPARSDLLTQLAKQGVAVKNF